MDLQAVLFDFDYTLGDATDVIVEGFWYAFDQLGLPRPGREAVRRTIGHKLEDEYQKRNPSQTQYVCQGQSWRQGCFGF